MNPNIPDVLMVVTIRLLMFLSILTWTSLSILMLRGHAEKDYLNYCRLAAMMLVSIVYTAMFTGWIVPLTELAAFTMRLSCVFLVAVAWVGAIRE